MQRPRLTASIGRIGDTDRDALGVERRRLREMDRRVEYLSRMCSNLEVIDPAQQRSDRVVFGATVSVCGEDDAEQTWRIVGVDEADAGEGFDQLGVADGACRSFRPGSGTPSP